MPYTTDGRPVDDTRCGKPIDSTTPLRTGAYQIHWRWRDRLQVYIDFTEGQTAVDVLDNGFKLLCERYGAIRDQFVLINVIAGRVVH